MEAAIWKQRPGVSVDPEIVHCEAVFAGTRVRVEDAIESVITYEELERLSREQRTALTIEHFPTIPGAEALRAILAFEASREPQRVL